MKFFKSIPRPVLYITLIISVFIFGGVSYAIGSKAVSEKNSDEAQSECAYTQDELDEILEKFESPETSPGFDELRAPPDSEAIMDLEGECADVGLEKAYDLGIRIVRDFSDCWPECIVTKEYLDNRMNYVIEDRRLAHVSTG